MGLRGIYCFHPEWYSLKGTDFEIPHYLDSSMLLLFPVSWIDIFSAGNTLSSIERNSKLMVVCNFNPYIF
jgi:hypothetical protein